MAAQGESYYVVTASFTATHHLVIINILTKVVLGVIQLLCKYIKSILEQ